MKTFYILFFLSLFISFSFGRNSIDINIIQNKKILQRKKINAAKIKNKLEDIALNIVNKKKEIFKINRQIKESNNFLNKQKNQYNKKIKELAALQSTVLSLNKSKKQIQKQIIRIISKELSIEIVANYKNNTNINSIISQEIVSSLGNILKEKFSNIQDSYSNVNKKIEILTKKIQKFKNYIRNMQNKRKLLDKMKRKREKNIKNLKYQKFLYDKKLNRIFSEQNAIKRTLTKLNILKQRRISKNRKKIKITNINSQRVRKYGSSYQHGKVARYRGAKTIAPLKSFYVKRKFGEYFDPIYKIKIFNESVILKSKIPNAKVRNVLNGKVIFAKSTPILDNVVIVENANGVHTIYAHLSKIAPTIKKGMKIRKGYIIGRIRSELTFEVTQKNSHINPLRLIRF